MSAEPGISNRRGRISISGTLLRTAEPEKLMAIMGRMIVVRCEHLWGSDTFEYEAISPDFDEVQEGCMAPQYDVVCYSGDPFKFTFKKWGNS